jgi:hypothetical protein
MSILNRLRNGRPPEHDDDLASTETTSPDADGLPVPGYDRLDHRTIGERLHGLSQVELGAVETYERSHKGRPEVLNKLRYMRTVEPLPGYDTLDTAGVVDALAGADSARVKAIRNYERKFKRRKEVLDEAARVLPTSRENAHDAGVREAQSTLVREGITGRDKTADGLAAAHARDDERPDA